MKSGVEASGDIKLEIGQTKGGCQGEASCCGCAGPGRRSVG